MNDQVKMTPKTVGVVVSELEKHGNHGAAAEKAGISKNTLTAWKKKALGDYCPDVLDPLRNFFMDSEDFIGVNRDLLFQSVLKQATETTTTVTIKTTKIAKLTPSEFAGLSASDKDKIQSWFDSDDAIVVKAEITERVAPPDGRLADKILRNLEKESDVSGGNDKNLIKLDGAFWEEMDGKLYPKHTLVADDNTGERFHRLASGKLIPLTSYEIGLLQDGSLDHVSVKSVDCPEIGSDVE